MEKNSSHHEDVLEGMVNSLSSNAYFPKKVDKPGQREGN